MVYNGGYTCRCMSISAQGVGNEFEVLILKASQPVACPSCAGDVGRAIAVDVRGQL